MFGGEENPFSLTKVARIPDPIKVLFPEFTGGSETTKTETPLLSDVWSSSNKIAPMIDKHMIKKLPGHKLGQYLAPLGYHAIPANIWPHIRTGTKIFYVNLQNQVRFGYIRSNPIIKTHDGEEVYYISMHGSMHINAYKWFLRYDRLSEIWISPDPLTSMVLSELKSVQQDLKLIKKELKLRKK